MFMNLTQLFLFSLRGNTKGVVVLPLQGRKNKHSNRYFKTFVPLKLSYADGDFVGIVKAYVRQCGTIVLVTAHGVGELKTPLYLISVNFFLI